MARGDDERPPVVVRRIGGRRAEARAARLEAALPVEREVERVVADVVGGGEALEILANNDLGEPVYGTPAIVGSAIYVRSSGHLWAFGGK